MAVIDMTGQRFGNLAVANRAANDASGQAMWFVHCDCGATKTVRGMNLRVGTIESCGKRSEHERANPPRPHYAGSHDMVRRAKGKASDHQCDSCPSRAAQWSYSGRDPNEHVTPGGSRFSTDPSYYTPKCRICHHRFDHGGPTESETDHD